MRFLLYNGIYSSSRIKTQTEIRLTRRPTLTLRPTTNAMQLSNRRLWRRMVNFPRFFRRKRLSCQRRLRPLPSKDERKTLFRLQIMRPVRKNRKKLLRKQLQLRANRNANPERNVTKWPRDNRIPLRWLIPSIQGRHHDPVA